MRVVWTSKASVDLARLHAFLAPVSPRAAAAVVLRITESTKALAHQPRMGSPLSNFAPKDVRRLIVGDYELRYEVSNDVVSILRLWHTREER